MYAPSRWTEVKSEIASTVMVCTVSFEVISELQRDRHHSNAVAEMHLKMLLVSKYFIRVSVTSRNLQTMCASLISLSMHESLGTKLCVMYTLTPSLSVILTLGVLPRRAFTVYS